MRLFLASASVRGPVEELTDLVGEGARVAVLANALDTVAADERGHWLEHEMTALRCAGLSPVELDLRDYDSRTHLARALDGVELVWATGGNAFVLRKAVQRSGLDDLLLARLRHDTLAYGGCSAGACICGPSLRGIELIDDAWAAGEPVFSGLGLIEFAIAPHFRAPGEAGELIDRLVEHYRVTGAPYRALRDGQAIVVRDGRARTVDWDVASGGEPR